MALTTHLLLALRLKKKESYTFTPPLDLQACSRVNFTCRNLTTDKKLGKKGRTGKISWHRE